MSRSPQAISSAAVRRHLEAAGPTVAQVLAAVTTEGAPPVGIQPLVDHVEQTKRWALESGSRHAAWLLYMAARSCLAQIPEYAADTEWVGGQVGSCSEFTEKYTALRRRARGLGDRLPPWDGTGAALGAMALAEECLGLAQSIRPDWAWLCSLGAEIGMATQRFDHAESQLSELWRTVAEHDLLVALLRNLLNCRLELGTIAASSDGVSALSTLIPTDRLSAFYRASLHAARGDQPRFDAALEQIVSMPDDRGVKYWSHLIERNVADWADGLRCRPESITSRTASITA